MKVMLLAAGRGKRMRELTAHQPKSLIQINGKALIEYHLAKLAVICWRDVVINLGYRGEQIRAALGDGSRYGVHIDYSKEPEQGYETGGGIFHALPLLGDAPFVVINSDIYTDYPFEKLQLTGDALAHLVMVENPAHNREGDFGIQSGKLCQRQNDNALTFAGIGVYQKTLFEDCEPGFFPLRPLIEHAMASQRVSAECYDGLWTDVGTPERLAQVEPKLFD